MKNYLLIDFGSTNTKLTAVDVENATILGTAKHFTTVEEDIRIGYNNALEELYSKCGKIEFEKTIACSSAAGGLKMAAIGLVEELTVEAAKRACYGAGGKVDLVFSHYITSGEVEQIKEKKIDIVLLAGGTNGGNSDCVLFNAEMLGKGGVKVPIVYAGNKSCQDQIKEIFDKYQLNGYICDNIMPTLNVLNIDAARDVIRKIFLNNIIAAKGIKKIEENIDGGVVLPTPFAVLKAAELLSKGYLHDEGLGDIVLIDIGGATTDVYSMGSGTPKRADVILKGLEEPYAKRTVEGDLGMRYSAEGIVKALNEQEIKLYKEKGIDLISEAKYRNEHVDMLPTNEHEREVDTELGAICTDIAIGRHAGKMESVYSPMGMLYYQIGKDLTTAKYVIGTGGVIINNPDPKKILERICCDSKKPLELRPKNPTLLLDKEYILSAMGLLSLHEPEAALKIMKKNISEI